MHLSLLAKFHAKFPESLKLSPAARPAQEETDDVKHRLSRRPITTIGNVHLADNVVKLNAVDGDELSSLFLIAIPGNARSLATIAGDSGQITESLTSDNHLFLRVVYSRR